MSLLSVLNGVSFWTRTVKSSLTLNQRNKKMLNLSYIKQVFCLNECGEIDSF